MTTGTGVQRSDQEYVVSLIHENDRFRTKGSRRSRALVALLETRVVLDSSQNVLSSHVICSSLTGSSESARELYKSDQQNCERRVPGEIKRSRDLRGGRWSWTLNLAQKRS